MPQVMKIEDDPRIQALYQQVMDEGSDEFEMVGYKEIRVIKEPKESFNCLIEVDIYVEGHSYEFEDTLQAGWNGSYEELFELSARKEKLLQIFYNATLDLLGHEDESYEHH